MKTVQADKVKIGDKLLGNSGETFTVTNIRQGDYSPFGKIGKFWHSKPMTLYLKCGNEKTMHVCAPSDTLQLAA